MSMAFRNSKAPIRAKVGCETSAICWIGLISDSMAKNTQGTKGEWMSVPAFGDWDQQQGMPDYSLDFSKIREMRMQNKSDYSRISVGNEEELLPRPGPASAFGASTGSVPPAVRHQESPPGRKKFMNYFVCCIRA